ncbi:VapA/VapB family virulence-associated protein [Xenorhabdus sp. BG5]|uniref:VapA/VapB family virulence-associated protein n=1 Tax=Xenorhabdus sp. BG5 TaxID=2782014 RepID=UPI001881C98B|nr:VapA/VapB family virulence-associated protein [Xenorhabdus sp. BG5]MBE8596987.1 VapA/VapB family virulence-associated protein [Xenorhabdus sp. BG5]
MNKPLSTESEFSLLVSKELKIIESLSEETANMLKHKTTDDSIIKSSEPKTRIYKATLDLTSYIFYATFTLEVEGLKTFYGKAGAYGFPGKGSFSGDFVSYTDDVDVLYREATSFLAVVTPLTITVGFIASFQKVAQFNGTGLGTITSSLGGGGYWE